MTSDQMSARIAIVVTASVEQTRMRAAMLASSLGLPLVQSGTGYDYILELSDRCLQLHDEGQPQSRPLVVDPVRPLRGTQPGGGMRKQPLARAMGKGVKTIVDATAGFGHDAVLLAATGYRVTAVERAGVIHALLEDGLKRAQLSPDYQKRLHNRLECIHADAGDYLGSLVNPPDVVYLDPMYPPKRKQSALAKKSLRILRDIVGDDADAEELIDKACRVARRRVVVKRPHYAPVLAEQPDMSITSKLVRYDIYLSANYPERMNAPY